MTTQPGVNSAETVLQRIDAILDELQALRQSVEALLGAHPVRAMQHGEWPSILDVVQRAPGHRVFQDANDVAHYLREERTAWND